MNGEIRLAGGAPMLRFLMPFRVLSPRTIVAAACMSALLAGAAAAQQPVQYRVSFPAPEHHSAQVEVTWSAGPAGTLEARMSRSSPGRYAVHEFSKNVFE